MGMHPQNRFPRLAIVDSTDKRRRQPSGRLRWWGPESPLRLNLDQPTQAPPNPMRIAVMPVRPRGLWLVALAGIWKFLRRFFVPGASRQGGAAVLSFRRYAAQAQSFHRAAVDQTFANKRASGSVGWSSEAAPREGGRG
jgi:hypothetical protein